MYHCSYKNEWGVCTVGQISPHEPPCVGCYKRNDGLIERVARAICAGYAKDEEQMRSLWEARKEFWMGDAKRALEAIN